MSNCPAPRSVADTTDLPTQRGTILPAQYLTVDQVATILSVSIWTVVRQFGAAEGVIDLGTPETLHKRRKRNLPPERPEISE